MIEIYKQFNTNYENNGDYSIEPVRCELDSMLNGIWQLELEAHQNHHTALATDNVIKINTSERKNQLFRINRRIREDDLIIVHAVPIFQDAKDEVCITEKKYENAQGKTVLADLCSGTKYTINSNITKTASIEFKNMNLIEAVNGMQALAFIKAWGGEITYDNYTMILNDKLGADNGYRLEFGLNIEAINEEIDTSETMTRIYPLAYDGTRIDEGYMDSPNISKYPKVYAKFVQFNDMKLLEDDAEGGFINVSELKKAMKQRVNQMFADGCDKHKINYKIDMVDLRQTVEYKDYEGLETIHLGDTVTCYYKPYDLTTKARVKRIIWDCISESMISVELGDYEKNFIFELAENTQKLTGQIDEVEKTAYSLIEKNDREIRLLVKDVKDSTEASISVMSNQISNKVSKGSVSSELNIEPDRIYMRSNRLVIDSDQFKLDEWGNAYFTGTLQAGVSISSPIITGGVIRGAQIEAGLLIAGNNQKLNLIADRLSYQYGSSNYTAIIFGDDLIDLSARHVRIHGELECNELPLINTEKGAIASQNSDYNIRFYNTSGNSNGASCGWVKEKIAQNHSSSDERIKENIRDLEYSSNYDELRPVRFDYKEGCNIKGSGVGFIAQEVQKLFPDWIHHEKEYLTGKERELTDGDMLEIDYSQLPFLNYLAIKELKEEIKKCLKQ